MKTTKGKPSSFCKRPQRVCNIFFLFCILLNVSWEFVESSGGFVWLNANFPAFPGTSEEIRALRIRQFRQSLYTGKIQSSALYKRAYNLSYHFFCTGTCMIIIICLWIYKYMLIANVRSDIYSHADFSVCVCVYFMLWARMYFCVSSNFCLGCRKMIYFFLESQKVTHVDWG